MLLGMEKHGVSRQSLENCIKQTDANGIDSLMAYFKSHFENEGQGPTTDTQKRHSTAEGFSDASRNPSSTALSSEPTTGRSPQPTAAQRPRALKKKAAAANKQQVSTATDACTGHAGMVGSSLLQAAQLVCCNSGMPASHIHDSQQNPGALLSTRHKCAAYHQ
jgi:hypothetical protein